MPGREKFQNFKGNPLIPGARLTLPIGSGDTTLTVDDPTLFSTAGTFTLLVDSELIRVGGVSGATLTGLTRGAEGTTAVAHAAATAVTQVVSALSGFQLWPNLIFTPTKVANYSANPQEYVLCDSSSTSFVVTVPLAATAGPNCPVVICDSVAGFGVAVIGSGSDTLVGFSGFVRQQTMLLVSDGVSSWYPVAGSGQNSQFNDLPPPRQTITAPYTLQAGELIAIFAAGTYPISAQNAVGGRVFRLKHDNLAPLEDASVLLSQGSAGFLIEDPNGLGFGTTVALNVSGACYEFMLDTRNNLLLCLGS